MAKNYLQMDLISFQKRYSSERACQKRLFAMRWPDGFRCPKCGSHHAYYLEKRRLYQCNECKLQTSLTSGTIMHRTRTPLVKWFWAIYLVSTDKRGLSALALSKKINIGMKCAWTMLHKIRKAMESRDADYKLAGLVQVDDAFFKGGIKKGGDKKGRGTKKVPVIVMAAVNNKALTFARMEVVSSVNSKCIKKAIQTHIAPKQTIRTDGWHAYKNSIEALGMKHERQVVYSQDTPPKHEFLNWVNILVSNAKAFILGTYHGVQKKHLQKYLNEFCYRFNRRFWPGQAFDRLLTACTKATPVSYAELRQ